MQVLETDLLSGPGVALVLAEPGSGKSALLASLAARFGTTPVKASIFERTQAPCILLTHSTKWLVLIPQAFIAL
ncbi:hypothetical protein GCM10011319_51930 [Mameliella alba]|nr:hypothetical protein GCM10011319_51930 [Mameliella alba]